MSDLIFVSFWVPYGKKKIGQEKYSNTGQELPIFAKRQKPADLKADRGPNSINTVIYIKKYFKKLKTKEIS